MEIINEKKKFIYKYIILGNGGSGKSTLIKKFIEGSFEQNMQITKGIDFEHKEYLLKEEIDNKIHTFNLLLWDFGGQERFRFILDSYLKGCRGYIFLFDLTSNPKEKDFENWISLICNEDQNTPIVIVGSKCDLVSEKMIKLKLDIVKGIFEDLKQTYPLLNIIFYSYCSSKLGLNIDIPFRVLTKYIFYKNNCFFYR